MAIEKFRLSTLASIDEGRIREAFEKELKRAEADCKDRPALKKPREVVLVAVLVPVLGHDGECESVDVRFEIQAKVPRRTSKVYNMRSTPGGLLFNELSPEDVRQGTIDEPTGPRSASHAR